MEGLTDGGVYEDSTCFVLLFVCKCKYLERWTEGNGGGRRNLGRTRILAARGEDIHMVMEVSWPAR